MPWQIYLHRVLRRLVHHPATVLSRCMYLGEYLWEYLGLVGRGGSVKVYM